MGNVMLAIKGIRSCTLLLFLLPWISVQCGVRHIMWARRHHKWIHFVLSCYEGTIVFICLSPKSGL